LSDLAAAQLDELSDRLSTQITILTTVWQCLRKSPMLTVRCPTQHLLPISVDQLRAELTAQQEDVMSVAAQAESNLAAAREAAQLEQTRSNATAQAASAPH
jgi:hypothetical protein